jgi:hypothetical protein
LEADQIPNYLDDLQLGKRGPSLPLDRVASLYFARGQGQGWSVQYRLFEVDPSPIEEDPACVDDVLAHRNSPEGELYAEVSEAVSAVLERADVDANNRQIIWEDGQRLSIAASAQRIEAGHPGYPLDLIEEHVIEWLEGEFAPPTYTRDQLDELDRLTESWVEYHRRQAQAAKKQPRTRHS